MNQGFQFFVTQPGFEPRQAESEFAVLPLYYRAKMECNITIFQ